MASFTETKPRQTGEQYQTVRINHHSSVYTPGPFSITALFHTLTKNSNMKKVPANLTKKGHLKMQIYPARPCQDLFHCSAGSYHVVALSFPWVEQRH